MKRAFSLIELLVVIGIIALLAAILLPVLSQAKAMAKQSASSTHLSQVLKAHSLYVSDWDDKSPLVLDLSLFSAVQRGLLNESVLGDSRFLPNIKQVLRPYGIPESLWKSPGDPGSAPGASSGSLYEETGSSYFYLVNNPCSGNLSSLSSPSDSGLFRDAAPFRSNVFITANSDGSVKAMTPKKSFSVMGNTDREWDCPNQAQSWH